MTSPLRPRRLGTRGNALALWWPGSSAWTSAIGSARPLALTRCCPRRGRGLVVLIQESDPDLAALLRLALHRPRDASCVLAERGFLSQLADNLDLPIAAWAEPGEDARGWLELSGRVLSLDGGRMVEGVVSEPVNGEAEAENLGIRLADDLMAQGAAELIEAAPAELDSQT